MRFYKISMIILSLTIVFLTFSGCEPNGYVGDDHAVLTLIHSECPYTTNHFGYSERVETDEHGRILFKYWSGHDLFFESGAVCIYAIIQKEDSDYIWYYGSDSYAMAPSWEAFTEERLDVLKSKNNWGKEMNTESADQVTILKHSPDRDYSIEHIKNVIEPMCKPEEEFKYSVMAVDEAGQVLVLFRLFTPNDDRSELTDIASYAAVIQSNGSCSEKSIIQIADIYNLNHELEMLKEAHGWIAQGKVEKS